ncbi:MAG: 50S ribosomal protein L16 [Candidatus Omnitrophica bacterium]|nr:50S ribosomal protein L16 [Candidatus Omnitrophota bacterium]
MPLMPKRVKYRKMQRGVTRGKASRGNTLFYGDFGLQILDPGRLSSAQIEAARVAITHCLKARGRIWIRIFPDRPVTRKPADSRMGKGKGDVSHWEAVVLPGRILFEIAGVEAMIARKALTLARYKLPYRCRIVAREAI